MVHHTGQDRTGQDRTGQDRSSSTLRYSSYFGENTKSNSYKEASKFGGAL